MPELPEVERIRRLFERTLRGKTIVEAEVAPDDIVLSKKPPELIQQAIVGREISGAGRKGKYWWLEFADYPWLYGHLGMAGWVRELGQPTIRIREHGNAPLDDENGRPRFLKLLITADDGTRVAMTDGRRLSRLWLGEAPLDDKRIGALGPDAWNELADPKKLHQILVKRKAPLKALLLDQKLFAGIGNWIADEVMFQARIAPKRTGDTLKPVEVRRLHDSILMVLEFAVGVDADKEQFPEDWLFHQRWGGSRGSERVLGQEIRRETVGGRTTAWVPALQK